MSRCDKPHRSSAQENERDDNDPFNDRRLSDVLPTEIVRQIGFDPDCYLFPRSVIQRRMTDPILLTTFPDANQSQRRATMIERYIPQPTPQSPLITGPQTWFLVELNDVTVNAYANFPIPTNTCDGVVVRDGCYLRFGRILEQLKGTRIDRQAPEIVDIDRGGELSDYVNGQTQVAAALMPSFLARAKCATQVLGVETVSYQARALFRVKVRNANAPNMDAVVRLLIQMFSIAVEIYD